MREGILVRFDDDPEQALRGALGFRGQLMEYNRARSKADHLRLRVRLTWGSGFSNEGDVFRDVVNLAARLERLARPGQILLSAAPQEVYELVAPDSALPKPSPGTAYSLLLVGPDGGTGAQFKLDEATTLLGRAKGEIRFPADTLLPPATPAS